MYCDKWSASDHNTNRSFHCNAAWVEIKQDGKVIYSRRADDTGTGVWFDNSHRKLYDAMRQLEECILEIQSEVK